MFFLQDHLTQCVGIWMIFVIYIAVDVEGKFPDNLYILNLCKRYCNVYDLLLISSEIEIPRFIYYGN